MIPTRVHPALQGNHRRKSTFFDVTKKALGARAFFNTTLPWHDRLRDACRACEIHSDGGPISWPVIALSSMACTDCSEQRRREMKDPPRSPVGCSALGHQIHHNVRRSLDSTEKAMCVSELMRKELKARSEDLRARNFLTRGPVHRSKSSP